MECSPASSVYCRCGLITDYCWLEMESNHAEYSFLSSTLFLRTFKSLCVVGLCSLLEGVCQKIPVLLRTISIKNDDFFFVNRTSSLTLLWQVFINGGLGLNQHIALLNVYCHLLHPAFKTHEPNPKITEFPWSLWWNFNVTGLSIL